MNATALDLPLPALREDLSLLEGPANSDGSPTWNIYDSVRNRYFRIGWLAFQLLSRWSLGTSSKLIKSVNEETTAHLTEKDIEDLLVFLYSNSLTVGTATGSSHDYVEQYESTKKNWLYWLVTNYLFFRIPLVRPNTFLKATLPFVEPIFSAKFRWFVFTLGGCGLYLVAREWDVFVNSFLYFFNIQGFFAYVCALVVIKILHELGHGYTAAFYNTKVSTMGVAFLVLFPVLYTDTSDSWRLTSRRQRLHIGMAGMMVELYIACISTFIWAFMPDGIFRSMAFLLATSSWLMSLSVNLNAFMRFDGYYILSDWWGIENLQKRSFDLGRWKLREILFAIKHPAPETLSLNTSRKLIVYAWFTWVYRLILFIGIALLVYYFFFKLLGIILFALEILWFILFPVMKEMKEWWSMKNEIIKSVRTYITLSVFASLILLCLIPWDTTVKLPAILESTENVYIHTPVSGQVKAIHVDEKESVKAGDLLLTLESPVLKEEITKTLKEIESMELHIKRTAANPEDLANIHIILSKLEELKSKHEGLKKQASLLKIYTKTDGMIIDREDTLHDGRWINQNLPLFNIINENEQQVIAMLNESDIKRIQAGLTAVFYPDNPELDEIQLAIKEIEKANIKNITDHYFNALYGGDVAVRQDEDGHYIPETGTYRVILQPSEPLKIQSFVMRGVIHVEGEAKSFFARMKDAVSAVLIRESGF